MEFLFNVAQKKQAAISSHLPKPTVSPSPLSVVSSGGMSQIKAASSYALVCTHIRPARVMKAWIGFSALHGVLDFPPVFFFFFFFFFFFYEDQTQPEWSCSVAGKFQRWEYFSPVATQSLYPNVIIRIRLFSLGGEGQSFPPWCVDIWFDWKGHAAWRVLVGSGGLLQLTH